MRVETLVALGARELLSLCEHYEWRDLPICRSLLLTRKDLRDCWCYMREHDLLHVGYGRVWTNEDYAEELEELTAVSV